MSDVVWKQGRKTGDWSAQHHLGGDRVGRCFGAATGCLLFGSIFPLVRLRTKFMKFYRSCTSANTTSPIPIRIRTIQAKAYQCISFIF